MLLYGIVALAVLLCFSLGALITLFVKNSNKNVRLEEQERIINSLDGDKRRLDNENSRLMSENTRLKTEYANHQRFMNEKLQYIEESKKDLAMRFQNISNEILKAQSQQINENQKNSLAMLLNPFKEQLQSFKDEMNKANIESTRNKLSFDEQFKKLIDMNQTLSQDAQDLSNALRGNKKMQGDWGEIELSRLLEISGLQKNIDYFTQENFKNEENQNVRPDVVVRLPNNRGVIIDSKVSLNDYVIYVNAENKEERDIALQKHIQCIKAHIDELSCKEYQKLLKEESLDYVVIFIPIESAFVAAITEDENLYDYAYKKNVALTTPSSLLPILRTVENLWRIENQNKHVQNIAKVGGSLYDKLAGFVEDMQKIDKALNGARQNYDTAIAKLSQGKGNALSLAQRLVDYGAKANKTIAIEFDDESSIDLMQLNDNSEEKVS